MAIHDITVKVTGASPLLMHNGQLANPLNKFARALKVATKKKKGQDPDEKLWKAARLEWEGGLYYYNRPGHALHGPVMPGFVFRACIRDAARISRGGKEIERGLVIRDSMMRLEYDGPREIEEMWSAGETIMEGYDAGDAFIHQTPVTVGRAKVLRTRPKFEEWSFTARLAYHDKVLGKDALIDYIQDAGLLGRLCDARSMGYGQFEVEFS